MSHKMQSTIATKKLDKMLLRSTHKCLKNTV